MNINFDPSGRQPRGILAQGLTVIVSIVALGAAFMFSLVVFALVAVVGLGLWLYFWWKTRALRRQIREQMRAQAFAPQTSESRNGGEVIEGEAVRVVESDKRLDQP